MPYSSHCNRGGWGLASKYGWCVCVCAHVCVCACVRASAQPLFVVQLLRASSLMLPHPSLPLMPLHLSEYTQAQAQGSGSAADQPDALKLLTLRQPMHFVVVSSVPPGGCPFRQVWDARTAAHTFSHTFCSGVISVRSSAPSVTGGEKLVVIGWCLPAPYHMRTHLHTHMHTHTRTAPSRWRE